MGDEQNMGQEGAQSPALAESEATPKRGRGRPKKEEASASGDAPQSESMDFGEYQEDAYVISVSYRARRVQFRTWVGREVHPGMFAEPGEWLVTRPDGTRFVLGNFEFRERFTHLEPPNG